MSGYRSGANMGRLVTKPNTAGAASLGSATLAGNAGTTSWVEITASLGTETLITKVAASAFASLDAGVIHTVQVGIGAGGAEAVIGTEPILPTPYTSGSTVQPGFHSVANLAVPLRVAAGQRVAVRVSTPGNLTGQSIAIRVFGVSVSSLENS